MCFWLLCPRTLFWFFFGGGGWIANLLYVPHLIQLNDWMDILRFLNFLFRNFGRRLNLCCVDKGRGRLVPISRVQGRDSKNVNEYSVKLIWLIKLSFLFNVLKLSKSETYHRFFRIADSSWGHQIFFSRILVLS